MKKRQFDSKLYELLRDGEIENSDIMLNGRYKEYIRYGTHAVLVRDHIPAAKLIRRITTKNQALLHLKHDHAYVRYHCKQILKGK